jgi:hypothetical protein
MARVLMTAIVVILFLPVARSQEVNSNNLPQFWPRLIRVSFRRGISTEGFKKFIADYGSRRYEGEPSPKKLNAEQSYDLEVVDESSSISAKNWIEIAVPSGQEEAWVSLIKLNPDVAEATRLSFATKGANPEDIAPLGDVPREAASMLIPLPSLIGIPSGTILDEIDRFVRDDLIPGQHPNPIPEGNINPSRRRVFFISNQRDLFMRVFWQQIIYDFRIYEPNGQLYLQLVLQAKVSPGMPPTRPPPGGYRPIESNDEVESLKEYKIAVESKLLPRLARLRK